MVPLLNVTTSTAAKERRLAALLDGRDPALLGLPGVVREGQAAGSLDLAGRPVTPDSVRQLCRAYGAVAPEAPFGVVALKAWHAAVTGGESSFRTEARPNGAPPSFIESRLTILEQWLTAESGRELKAEQIGALVVARLLEISPWDEGSGRVARIAASHLMVQAGGRPPILLGSDRDRLAAAVSSAFALATEPLATLLDEAQTRGLDVMIQALSK